MVANENSDQSVSHESMQKCSDSEPSDQAQMTGLDCRSKIM